MVPDEEECDKDQEGKLKAEKGKEADTMLEDEAAEYKYNEETSGSLAELSRSERKRDREKKRRSDVNSGLDRMMALIFVIDPQLKAEAEERAKKVQGGRATSAENPILSRVELINSAVMTLERIHRENEERKMVIAHLARGLLAGNANSSGAAAPESAQSAPAPPPHIMAALPNARGIQVSILFRVAFDREWRR
jgi:hypothetical protein